MAVDKTCQVESVQAVHADQQPMFDVIFVLILCGCSRGKGAAAQNQHTEKSRKKITGGHEQSSVEKVEERLGASHH